jgi:hypothetical protein
MPAYALQSPGITSPHPYACKKGCSALKQFIVIATILGLGQFAGSASAASITPEKEAPVIAIRHVQRQDGWTQTETANFRIYHTQSREFAIKVATVAEQTRSRMAEKWFGGCPQDWTPRCDVILYATGAEYSQATGIPAFSPGRSYIGMDGGRVVRRQIDLHCEDPNRLLRAVLIHETTHVVLGGQFGEQQIPRWADEGMAILSEPSATIEGHRRSLRQCYQDGLLFHLRDLMQLGDYPEPRRVAAFYAESVSLVEFLANEKGPEQLAPFVRDARKLGYEAALKRHYGYGSFEELEQKWMAKSLTAE